MQGQARSGRSRISSIDPKSPSLGWLIEHVGTLYIYSCMPTMRMQRMDLLDIGTLLDARRDTCMFLSIRLHTTEKIIGTSKGVVVVQSVRRKPADQQ